MREANLPMSTVKSGLHETYTVYDFIEKINPLLLKLQNRPLATFTVTRMEGEGSALGISFAHAVADGYSFYYFIKRWSQIHNNLPGSTPWHDRSVITFDAAEAPAMLSTLPCAIKGFRCLSSWQLLKLASTFLVQKNSIMCRVLRFTQPQLMAIKSAAGQQGPVSLRNRSSERSPLAVLCKTAKFCKPSCPPQTVNSSQHAAHHRSSTFQKLFWQCYLKCSRGVQHRRTYGRISPP